MTQIEYVHYGCGLCAPLGWRNFDASSSLRLQKAPIIGRFFRFGSFPIFPTNVEYGDIVKGLPVKPESCQAIYASHILEHLSLQDFRIAIKNTYNYLNQGGIFRLVMPDLEYLIRCYQASRDSEAAIIFMEQSGLGVRNSPRGFFDRARSWFGKSAHLWLWDYPGLYAELDLVRFQQIRRAQFHDSSEIRFYDVEDKGRWENCLGVECKR
jgi:predicted SAM-dependent methyltransferase